jgi:TfuA protein
VFCTSIAGCPLTERKLVVYAGASLPAKHRYFPATYLPPIARGDLNELVKRTDPNKTAVVIIDGCFGSTLSLAVMECRQAIEQGFALFGLSSMGALRAADLWPCGMIGFGQVYFWYRAGLLLDDSEVAVQYSEDMQEELTVSGVRCRIVAKEVARRLDINDAKLAIVLHDLLSVPWMERTPEVVTETLSGLITKKSSIELLHDSSLNPKMLDAQGFFDSLLLQLTRPNLV